MTSKTPGEVLQQGADVHEEKNDDYGDSWRVIGHVLFAMANEEPVTLDSPEDWIRVGLYTRRLDKVARAFNGEFQADELNFESVVDTHADESVYAAMAASLADGLSDKEDEE